MAENCFCGKSPNGHLRVTLPPMGAFQTFLREAQLDPSDQGSSVLASGLLC